MRTSRTGARRCAGATWAVLAPLAMGCNSIAGLDELSLDRASPSPTGGAGGSAGGAAGGSAGGAAGTGGMGGAGAGGGVELPDEILCANAMPTDMDEEAWIRGAGWDNDDGVVVVGQIRGTYESFGIEIPSDVDRQALVMRVDADCRPTYIKLWGGDWFDRASDVAIDSIGNAVVVGQFGAGPASFDGVTLMGGSGGSTFIAKLAPDGELLWVRGFLGNGNSGRRLAVDDDGAIVVLGTLNDTMTAGTETADPVADRDLYVAKLDSSGNVQWLKVFGGADWEWPEDVAIDPNGLIAVVGGLFGTVTLGADVLTSTEQQDAFIALLDPSGNPIWARSFGAEPYVDDWRHANENMRVVEFMPNGEIVAMLKYGQEVDLGSAGLLDTAGYRANALVTFQQATGTTLSATVWPSPDSEHLRLTSLASSTTVSARFVLDPFEALGPYAPFVGGRALAFARHGADGTIVDEWQLPLAAFVGTPNVWDGADPLVRVGGLAENANGDIFVAVGDAPSVGVTEPFLRGSRGTFFARLRLP